MQTIPLRHFAAVPSAAGVVVSESVEDVIQHGLEPLNQHRLRERNPNVVDDKKTAGEVRKLQILCGIDRLCVFCETTKQRLSVRNFNAQSALMRSRRNGFADIDGQTELPAAIRLFQHSPKVGKPILILSIAHRTAFVNKFLRIREKYFCKSVNDMLHISQKIKMSITNLEFALCVGAAGDGTKGKFGADFYITPR